MLFKQYKGDSLCEIMQGVQESLDMIEHRMMSLDIIIEHDIYLVAIHKMGEQDPLAHHLSRSSGQMHKWSLKDEMVNHLFSLWRNSIIDPFASSNNRKCQRYCSRALKEKESVLDPLRSCSLFHPYVKAVFLISHFCEIHK